MAQKQRCKWPKDNPLMIEYHDKEWGVPVHNDIRLFEFLILEGAQAGLTWEIILRKRENYRKAFSDFNPAKISHYTEVDEKRLLADKGIVRNRLKIRATIINAGKFLEVQKEYGSFDKYIWQFVSGKSIMNGFSSVKLSATDIIILSKSYVVTCLMVGPLLATEDLTVPRRNQA
jgi:DNA-3-methyladenine glycosylase I